MCSKEKYCRECGESISSKKTFCDSICYEKNRKVDDIKKCNYCKEDFACQGSSRLYCSKECRTKGTRVKNGYKKKLCQECKEEILGRGTKYCSNKCKGLAKAGKNNSFYGKKHSKETREKIRNALSGKLSGDKNPFYGKIHSDATKQKIIDGNKKFREENKVLVLERTLRRLGLTESKLEGLWHTYSTTLEFNQSDLKRLAGNIDIRSIKKYLFFFNIVDEDEFEKTVHKKKMGRAGSSPERRLYEMLCAKFGRRNISRQFKIERKFYDFIVFGKYLIEYDGYYWHNNSKSRDDIKDDIAKRSGYPLYRVKEPKNRSVDFIDEIEKIEGFINEVRIS